MIQFLNLKDFKKGLKPVTSAEIFSKINEFNPEGLYSEIIFGPEESLERKKTFSYIELHVEVIHPSALQILKQLNRNVIDFISTNDSFSVDKAGTLIRDPNGVTGISSFIELFPKIKFRGESPDREKFIKKIQQSFKDNTMFVDIIPVIPATQRPIYQEANGQWRYDELNDYYIKIIRRALQIKSISKSGALFDLLNYELQKAVVEHDEYIRKIIGKKRGLIRSQLLGKRTDYSGRGVIITGPNLKVNEIGLPLRMAVSLFEPFLLHRFFHSGQVDQQKLADLVQGHTGLELSTDSIRMVFKAIKNGDEMNSELYKMILEAAEIVSKDRAVLAKRDPVLQPESVRAFKPVITQGKAIEISTLQVGGFNADFDGDQMAVFHPITDEAQEEVKTKMMRSQSGVNSQSVNFELSKEMAAGLYYITKTYNPRNSPIAVTEADLEKATNPRIAVKYRGKNTTMGRAILNSAFPKNFPFINRLVTKSMLNKLIPSILEDYGQEQAIETYSKLKDIGFKFATLSAPAILLDNMEIPPDILEIKQKLKNATTEEAAALLDDAEKKLKKYLEGTGFYDLVESGAGKGWMQPRQILVAKGLVSDPTGKVLPPIQGSYADGLTNKEYFEAASGSRKGIIDRVINTGDTGYMARQLAYALNNIEAHRTLKDCKTIRTLDQRLTSKLVGRLSGRFVLVGGSVKEFKQEDFKIGDVIHLRSPIYCLSPKVCHTCYGRLLERHRTPYVGVLASQIIGEAGTQTIMRTFHTGGAVKIIKKEILKDIIQNDPIASQQMVKKNLYQTENSLFTNSKAILTIDKSDYEGPNSIIFDEQKNSFLLKGLISKIEFQDVIFNIILDFPVELQAEQYVQDKNFIKITYDKDSPILEASLETDDTKKQINYVLRLIGGREIYKDADHLFLKLFRVYEPLRNMDSVHLEVLLSNVLRDKKNPSIPARLGPTWDPVMMNIKTIVFKTSFVQGLAFENVNQAIKTGLITEEPEDPSVLEKVLSGELAPKKKR